MKKITQVPYLALLLIALNMPENAWGVSECCFQGQHVYAACLVDCNSPLNVCVATLSPCIPSQGAPKMDKNKVKIVTKEEFEKIQQNKSGNKK